MIIGDVLRPDDHGITNGILQQCGAHLHTPACMLEVHEGVRSDFTLLYPAMNSVATKLCTAMKGSTACIVRLARTDPLRILLLVQVAQILPSVYTASHEKTHERPSAEAIAQLRGA